MNHLPELFATLLELAPPPADPVDPGSPEEWSRVEDALGIALPADYKWLIDTYGSGDFGDLLVVMNPFAPSGGMNLLCQINFEVAEQMGLMCSDIPILMTYQEGREELIPEQCPFPTYPEPGGLLPVAGDTNGDNLFWLTEGHPDQWSLVHYDWRGGWEYQQHRKSLVGFMVDWLSGRMPESFFGVGNSEIVRRDPVFIPVG
jgi:hypothetical protein